MDTADDVDFEPLGFEDGIAERTEPGMFEDVIGTPTMSSDCNGGMHVRPRTVGLKSIERRSQGRAAPKLCKRPQASGPGDRKSQWAHVPGPHPRGMLATEEQVRSGGEGRRRGGEEEKRRGEG